MNKKNLMVITLIILMTIITLLIVIIPNYSYATEDRLGLDDLNKYQGDNPGSEKLKSKANTIFSYLRTIGIVLSVVALIAIGIKYMLGSVEEKADLKKSMIPYVIGMFLLVCATTLPNIIYNIVQSPGFFG